MKSPLLLLFVGFLLGLASCAAAVYLLMPGLMIHERTTTLPLQVAVEKLSAAAKEQGWVVSGVMNIDESIVKHGGKPTVPVRLVNLCQADHASRILNDPASRRVSVMMPCTISLYSDEAGQTHVASMNASLMGRMFGGVVADVMGGRVGPEQETILSALEK